MVADGSPFAATDNANVFDRKNSKEQIFVRPIIPVLVIHDGMVEMSVN